MAAQLTDTTLDEDAVESSENDLQDISISDDELMNLSAKDLNNKLRGLGEDVVAVLKQRRRTLKNRGYAQSSRNKRVNQRLDLEKDKETLREELDRVAKENDRLKRERDETKRKYNALIR